ncbi:MAG: YggS family pyridoxal phosphate-dependent enzyme [Phycisphaeraceae bacterium]
MTTQPTAEPMRLRDAYRQVCDRIAAAAERSGRRPDEVLMVAVTKNASPDQIRTLVELGQVDLAENRVQQLNQRVVMLEEFLSRKRTLGAAAEGEHQGAPAEVRWHMVGHLQRNKAKQVIPLVTLIHSVDSLRLAEEIHNYCARQDRVADVLIQVNASGEASKHGIAPPAVIHFAEQIDTMIHLRLRGLMTMAPYSDNPEDARPVFGRTAELFHELRRERVAGGDCNILSMGMSGDFEVAIEEGANVVRIGQSLFGPVES